MCAGPCRSRIPITIPSACAFEIVFGVLRLSVQYLGEPLRPSTFNSTFDAFKGSTLNSLDASMDLGEMGASRLMPSEIGRATMENAYRGKFPVGERGPFNGAQPYQ